MEEVNAFNGRPRNDPYSNTYNPGWRQHPNFSWSNSQNTMGPTNSSRSYQQPYQAPPPQQEDPSIKEMLSQLLKKSEKYEQEVASLNQSQLVLEKSLSKFEVQLGQIATTLNRLERVQGQFPSQTEANPRNHEQIQAITTLRSGKVVDNKTGNAEINDKEEDEGMAEIGQQFDKKFGGSLKSEIVEGGMSSPTTEEWLPPLLRGFRFHPSEEEMVNLLRKKMEGQGSQAMPEVDYKPLALPNNESISLVLRFLKQMMQGIIPEIDVCKYEPWDLAGLMFPDSPYQPRVWFSFSRPDYKYTNSHRKNRTTAKGSWKITGKQREIKSGELPKSVTCKKRTLTFHESCVSKSMKTDWFMQEYYLTQTESGSIPKQLGDFVLCRMKNKSANCESDNKKLKADSICDEAADPGIGGNMASNSEDDQATANHMIPEADRHVAHKELEHDVPGSGTGNHDAGEPGGCVSSDLVDDMIQELSAQPGEYLDFSFRPPEPPQPGNASVPSPIGNNDSSLPNKNNIPTNYDSIPVSNTASNFGNQTTHERSSEVYSQSEEKLQSFYCIELDTLRSPISYDLGDFQYAKNYIGCTESQSAAPFPQNS